MLAERIQDICHFLITFHTPISFSTPHIYISTQPFLLSKSHLLMMFDRKFTGAIKMRVGKLSSWPAPPLDWTGHAKRVNSVRYLPNGAHVVTGSHDKTIRIWDAESGAVVGEPLRGHDGVVLSVAYSPDGRQIISGSGDCTIRIWDAKTGAAVGGPLKGHTSTVWTLRMGTTSPLDPAMAPFESGMPKPVPQSVVLSKGTLTRCCSLLTLPMGGTSSLDLAMAPFESGIPRLVSQLAILSKGTLARCCPLLILPMVAILSLELTIAPFESGMPDLVLQLAILSRGTLAG